jgi:hypothetical protein
MAVVSLRSATVRLPVHTVRLLALTVDLPTPSGSSSSRIVPGTRQVGVIAFWPDRNAAEVSRWLAESSRASS